MPNLIPVKIEEFESKMVTPLLNSTKSEDRQALDINLAILESAKKGLLEIYFDPESGAYRYRTKPLEGPT
jgi:hypothetical protein